MDTNSRESGKTFSLYAGYVLYIDRFKNYVNGSFSRLACSIFNHQRMSQYCVDTGEKQMDGKRRHGNVINEPIVAINAASITSRTSLEH